MKKAVNEFHWVAYTTLLIKACEECALYKWDECKHSFLKVVYLNSLCSGLVTLWLQFGGRMCGWKKVLLTILNLLGQTTSTQDGTWWVSLILLTWESTERLVSCYTPAFVRHRDSWKILNDACKYQMSNEANSLGVK